MQKILLALFLIVVTFSGCKNGKSPFGKTVSPDIHNHITSPESLVVLWTSPDKDVALHVVFSYLLNAAMNGWLEDITLMVMGPAVDILANDKEVQNGLTSLKHARINIMVCKSSSENYKVTDMVDKLEVEVLYIGKTLTAYLKDGLRILTF